jgi:hypothetical protein
MQPALGRKGAQQYDDYLTFYDLFFFFCTVKLIEIGVSSVFFFVIVFSPLPFLSCSRVNYLNSNHLIFLSGQAKWAKQAG